MQLKIGVVLAIFILFFQPATAQHTYHHNVVWGRLVLSDKITTRSKWELYLQKRTQNVPGQKSPIEARHFSSIWLWFSFMLSKDLKLYVSPIGYFDSYAFLTKPADVEIPGVKEFRWAAIMIFSMFPVDARSSIFLVPATFTR